MGLLYGAYLSRENQVYLLCNQLEKRDAIQKNGVSVQEKDGAVEIFHPKALCLQEDTLSVELDYLILFVKATGSRQALEEHKQLISPKTTLLTLQNGAGHEELLGEFADKEQIAVGISQEGSLLLSQHEVRHTGSGYTYFGKSYGDSDMLGDLEASCNNCGFLCEKSNDIQSFLWGKLIFNASSSVLSGILAVNQGYCHENPYAWSLIEQLVGEIVAVAVASGVKMDYDSQILRVKTLLTEHPEGVPSICVDLKQGRLTEVSTISGAVLSAGKRLGIATPTTEFVVTLVKAMESRGDFLLKEENRTTLVSHPTKK